MLPLALIRFASAFARWSAQRMMSFGADEAAEVGSHELGETETGLPSFMLTTASEHVASKPMPRTSELDTLESRRTSLHALEMQLQTESERRQRCRSPSPEPHSGWAGDVLSVVLCSKMLASWSSR